MMKISIFIIVAIGMVAGAAILNDKEEWQKFKSQHHKLYQSNGEEQKRFKIFKENLHQIRVHNEKYDKGEATYKMGINKFSDLTPEEFKKIHGRGVLPRKTEDQNGPFYE